ncbi:hypothetical protein SDC9_150472 [bioreactor metagenome]|uniref:Uncharacterized protein n=1 Tax=bioreactor metagenome TaxID=1076179 RepID=A0A645EMK2_9ZZZZ
MDIHSDPVAEGVYEHSPELRGLYYVSGRRIGFFRLHAVLYRLYACTLGLQDHLISPEQPRIRIPQEHCPGKVRAVHVPLGTEIEKSHIPFLQAVARGSVVGLGGCGTEGSYGLERIAGRAQLPHPRIHSCRGLLLGNLLTQHTRDLRGDLRGYRACGLYPGDLLPVLDGPDLPQGRGYVADLRAFAHFRYVSEHRLDCAVEGDAYASGTSDGLLDGIVPFPARGIDRDLPPGPLGGLLLQLAHYHMQAPFTGDDREGPLKCARVQTCEIPEC